VLAPSGFFRSIWKLSLMWDDDGYEVYEENEFPLAYLLTFRTYGTWLHGDERGAVDTHGWNRYGSPRKPPNPKLLAIMRSEMKGPPFLLTLPQREIVEHAVSALCERRFYELRAVQARTNHVHAVIAAGEKPERIVTSLKAEATRQLREQRLVSTEVKIWSRGRSRRYLWKPRHVGNAIEYVINGQSNEAFVIEGD
jgi:REP element-mobilizing transposase RayT